ncbi:MAG: hypothetical protein A2W90_07680 [Bacteroidetes bacterium GWF2_42_66]|nr:MAG: hypothetical protein A2W92_09595 [Bacteroidetes bacterium GWA2_42_15]OFX96602.1 MAG: hypothetical protein A2W89_13580 [Bacteroidetes bacterium GWE2_42_39]OFY45327.1 MAG: hypothetical protein A2W90_07680 [Bacteroidetes bacterium GWF2_42_66]HBL78417.1 hypothetical protein [Prolixibacteraceae bacterium]HCR90774.1 hypothetical protein [Prolixibacteraceae bacterium]
MDNNEKFDQLFADEVFQDEILHLQDFSEEAQKAICEKYSLSEKELAYAKKFLSGMSFRTKELVAEEINYAVHRLQKTIHTTGKNIKFITLVSRVAAVLSIPLFLSTLYFYQKSQQFDETHLALAKTINTFEAPAGAKTQVVLPDGSLVWLNSGSRISFPAVFNSKSRDVELKGEAFFEVVKNEKVPMVVSTPNLNVKVYGTKFNLKAFEEDKIVETALLEGKISVFSGKGKQEYFLEPGQAASFSIQNQKLQISKVDDMSVYTGWRDGKLIFNDESFAGILQKLERWYNVDIQLTDPELGNYSLYATFFDENIEQVLEIFSNSIPISVEYPKREKQADGNYSKRAIIIKRDPGKKLMVN